MFAKYGTLRKYTNQGQIIGQGTTRKASKAIAVLCYNPTV